MRAETPPAAGPATVVVTGAAGDLGRRLVARLEADPTVGRVVALDRRPVPEGPKAVAYQLDLSTAPLAPLLEGADAVVHLAWSRPGPRDRAPASADLVGTRRLLEAAAAAGVRRLVHLSSATVYGAWPDNPVPLTEDAPVRPNPGFAYAVGKAEAERLVAEWREAASGRAAVLRPAVVLGARRERWLSRALGTTAQPGGEPGRPQQFVHADDAVSAIVAALAGGLDGPYGVAPDGWLAADQARALGGSSGLRLPARMSGPLARLAFGLGLSDRSPAVEPYLRHPWVVANDRLRAAGWAPHYTNAEALVGARAGSRWSRVSPKHRQELLLGAAGLTVAGATAGAAVLVRRAQLRTRAARPG